MSELDSNKCDVAHTTKHGVTSGSARVTFLGAAMTVTGSKFLLEYDRNKVLVDCGLFQGTKDLRLQNWQEPSFDIAGLDAVVLTHAHIDHSGYLPLLWRKGYRGPIYATAPTCRLLEILLPDSARLQEEEARFANEHGTSQHVPAKPLYSYEDAMGALDLLRPLEKNKTQKLLTSIAVTARSTGHILGAVSLTFDLGKDKRVSFTGDVGRYDVPILPDPSPMDYGDLLICESTYGDRLHSQASLEEELARSVKSAMHRKGPLIIPAFAVGRTQHLLYMLAELERSGAIPELPVYVDSPMAVDVTAIYRQFKDEFDEEAKGLMSSGEFPLRTAKTVFCRSREESMRLNDLKGTRIIISASGMVTGGRVLHHMAHWLDREETTVLLVGYQAHGTRGRIIQSGAKEVKIFGRMVPIRGRVETISGLSAHADRGELLRFLRAGTGTPGQVKIVHGEPEAARAFSATLRKELNWNSAPAESNEIVEF